MKKLHFSIDIAAPARRVWDTMLQPASYREWTAEFCPGSYCEGTWEEGSAMRFLTPSGEGMYSRIAVSRPHSFLSIQHLGELAGGVESTAPSAWTDACENYTLIERDGTTRLEIEMDAVPEFEAFLQQTWPKALARLKALSERA